MKMHGKQILAAVAALAGLGLFAAVFVAGDGMSGSMVGLCAGLGGALLGIGGGGIFLPVLMGTMTPEQRKEVERSERDERMIAVRQLAAQNSWYWTLYLLWVPFVAALVRGEIFWMVLCPAVLVLHCVFYLANLYRWSRKL